MSGPIRGFGGGKGLDAQTRRSLDRFTRPELWTESGLDSNNNGKLARKHSVTEIDATDSPYTATPGEYIDADLSTGAITVNLPDATTCKGEQVLIKNIANSTNKLTVDGSGSQTIDGITTREFTSRYHFVNLVSDGSNWQRRSWLPNVDNPNRPITFTGPTDPLGPTLDINLGSGMGVNSSGALIRQLGVTSISGLATATVDDLTLCDPSGGGFTVNLPAAADSTGRTIIVKNETSSTNTITVDANGSELIDDAATYAISEAYGAAEFVCDGTGWHVTAEDRNLGLYLPLAGGTMSGNINLGDNDLLNVNQIAIGTASISANTRLRIIDSSPAATPTISAGDVVFISRAGNLNVHLHTGGSDTAKYAFTDGAPAVGATAYDHATDTYSIIAGTVTCATFDGTNSTINDAVFIPDTRTTTGGADAHILATGEIIGVTSSRRHKENIRDLDFDALAELMKLTPKLFNYRQEVSQQAINPTTLGLIADDMIIDSPTLAQYLVSRDVGDKPWSVAYSLLGVLALQAIKQLEARISALEK